MKKGLKVKIWMLENDIQGVDIVKTYGCDTSMVSRFLIGKRTSKKLADHMIHLGCPKEFFNNGRVAA